MSTTPGSAFGITTDDAPEPTKDVDGFSLRGWIKGTALVTRSVDVCGMPQLMGQIEGLKAELERAQASDFDDDRPLVRTQAMRIAEELEAARQQMLASVITWRFRGLRNGEVEQIKAADEQEHGKDGEGITRVDYKIWAAQCVQPKGVTWEDLRDLHIGNADEGIEGLGAYFMQTIARTANAAASGGGVDVPFSSASSALIATSSKS